MIQKRLIFFAYLGLKVLNKLLGALRPRAGVWAFEASGGASGEAAVGGERGYGGKSWQKQYKKYINTQENQLTKRA